MFGKSVKDAQCIVSIGPWDLDVTYSANYTPGRTYGPPEDCYPDDSELEITSITYSGEDITDLLSEKALEQIEAKVWEDANATWQDDGPDPDAMYDAWREEQERRCE